MVASDLVVRSQLVSPPLRQGLLRRPRVHLRLHQGLSARYILVQAGAGYGKSTAVAIFLEGRSEPRAWYSLEPQHNDPLLFCAHLIVAADALAPGAGVALDPLLAQARAGALPWLLVVDALDNYLFEHLSTEAWLVLDDIHLVLSEGALPNEGTPRPLAAVVDRFLAHLPPRLHVILTSRSWVDLPTLTHARARSQLAYVTDADLRLGPAEIHELLRLHNAGPLTSAQANRLSAETEGWVMAVQLLAQQLQGLGADSLDQMLADLPGHLHAMFDYLAENILQRQPPEVQTFLADTAILRQLEAGACDAVRGVRFPLGDDPQPSAAVLARLYDAGLSLVQVGEHTYRHHPLVRAFLERQVARDPLRKRTLHRRAAAYFLQTDRQHGAGAASSGTEESVYHLLRAGDCEAAAHQIRALAPVLIQTGRFFSLGDWLAELPESLLDDQPDLRIVAGDVARLTSAYDAALAAYERARRLFTTRGDALGQAQALTSQALVYIDTVRPASAEALLKQALAALGRSHPTESARLLSLLAENACNRGRLGLAERWYQAAQRLHAPPDHELESRILLRSGQLDAARAVLAPAAEPNASDRPARAHREPSLLMAFLQMLGGEAEAAYANAQRGLELARRLHSPFTEAVAHMRIGHALQLRSGEGAAGESEHGIDHYLQAIELMRLLGVIRGEAEPQFGLALLYAFAGEREAAAAAGQRSLEAARRAGDAWVAGLAQLALGINLALNADPSAAETTLVAALADLEACGDHFGSGLAHLWLVWLACRLVSGLPTHLQANPPAAFAAHVPGFLKALATYPFLLVRPTLFGPRDVEQIIPLLVWARGIQLGIQPGVSNTAALAGALLAQRGLSARLAWHPGYTLRVQTLGAFHVWRGAEANPSPGAAGRILAHEWQRQKARQLFQLLLVYRSARLQREQICESLWPNADPAAAAAQFKAALNALQRVLEPARPRQAEPFFIQRHDTAYGLNPAAAIDLDAARFEQLSLQADAAAAGGPERLRTALGLYLQALDLYQGPFLPDVLYEEWACATRDHLQTRYLLSAERCARLLLPTQPSEALAWCERILAIDRSWEPAYRLSMRVHAAQGQRHLLARTYQQCVQALAQDLEMPPMSETTQLYHALSGPPSL